MPEAPRPVAERVLDAAAGLTVEAGWSHVTMGAVAARAGVSRQTVYNEYGVKPALGQAMVLRELDRFLAVVAEELDRGDDLVAAIRDAARRILELAAHNPLLHTVLTSAHQASTTAGRGKGDNDLLPFLTTDAAPLISAAQAVILERLGRFPGLGLDEHEVPVATEAIVRLVLSHVMQPAPEPARTADHLAWIVARLVSRPTPLTPGRSGLPGDGAVPGTVRTG